MKRILLKSTVAVLIGTMTLSSCIGSYSLFNKLLGWNQRLSNKFVNELVFLLISPVYGVCLLADTFILNTVEFWSGSNPIAKAGHVEHVWGQDGKMYAVKTLKNGYEITRPTGEKVLFVHNDKEDSWSIKENGKTTELFRYNGDGTVQACLPNGQKMDVSLNESGMYQLRMAVGDGTYFATR